MVEGSATLAGIDLDALPGRRVLNVVETLLYQWLTNPWLNAEEAYREMIDGLNQGSDDDPVDPQTWGIGPSAMREEAAALELGLDVD